MRLPVLTHRTRRRLRSSRSIRPRVVATSCCFRSWPRARLTASRLTPAHAARSSCRRVTVARPSIATPWRSARSTRPAATLSTADRGRLLVWWLFAARSRCARMRSNGMASAGVRSTKSMNAPGGTAMSAMSSSASSAGRSGEPVDRGQLAEQLARLLVTDRDLTAIAGREDELHPAAHHPVDVAGRIAFQEDDGALGVLARAPELAEGLPELGRRRRERVRRHVVSRAGRWSRDPHRSRGLARCG